MYRITAIICSAIVTISSVLGAAFVPTLPYVPPADVQIFGLLNNIYGISAISEGTETEKLEAYWNLYRAIMGSAFDTFQSEMQGLLDGVKTGRKMVITPMLNNIINKALKEGIQNNVPIGTGVPDATIPSQWVQRLREHGINMTLEQATALKNTIGNGYMGANAEPYTLAVYVDADLSCVTFTPYYVGMNLVFITRGSYVEVNCNGNTNGFMYRYNVDLSTMTISSYRGNTISYMAFTPYNNMYFTLKGHQQTTSISGISQNATDSVIAEDQIPITSETEIVEGQIDTTKNIIINLPSINPFPGITAEQIAEVLKELGVVPKSETEDVEETVSELKQEALTKYGDASEYALDLTRYFPFCLPFDVARILQAFVAEPEAPSFSYTINNPFSDEPEDDIVLEIDLSQFNDVAAIFRTLESIAFVVGLAVVTRSLYLRG